MELILKIKLLTASVAAVLLAGCGSDSDPVVKTYAVQAYDPAVIGMKVEAVCGDETHEAIELTTNYKDMVGQARFSHIDVVTAPGECEFVFTPTEDTKDATNGKKITSTYVLPKGLSEADQLATGSPFTTIIASALGEGDIYTPDAAEEIFAALGIEFNDTDVTVTELLQNTEAVMVQLHSESHGTPSTGTPSFASQLAATATVLSDVLSETDGAEVSVTEIAVTTATLTKKVLDAQPDYPYVLDENGQPIEDESGKTVVYVANVSEQVQETVDVVKEVIAENPGTPPADIVVPEDKVPDVPDPEVGEPIEPEDPPGGGTGGTGGN
ncbi:hypothetical protein VME_19660 [Vibrio harveyi 1DA3]|nr:hypothetical protein VME_19660 [Vibrio harveyi 1DA3]